MSKQNFEIGDLVWAHLKGFPCWPGKIIKYPEALKPSQAKTKKGKYYVHFFGDYSYSWVQDNDILLHSDELVERFTQKKRSALYKKAVAEILEESKHTKKNKEKRLTKEDVSLQLEKNENYFESLACENAAPSTSKIKREPVHEAVKICSSSNNEEVEIRPYSAQPCSSTRDSLNKYEELLANISPPPTCSKKHSSSGNEEVQIRPYSNEACSSTRDSLDKYKELFANIPPNLKYEDVPFSQGLLLRNRIEAIQPRPPIKDAGKKEISKIKIVQPTSKKIGFVGSGQFAQNIIKNLLRSGHRVIMMPNMPEESDTFEEIGAILVSSLAEVIVASDIIFCCMSDTDAAKKLVFGNCGVLGFLEMWNKYGRTEKKGYVELSPMDGDTAQAISEAIHLRGGVFLEARLIGSRLQAIEGKLFILAAGDKSLYRDCKTCFLAISSQSKFMGYTVGDASKYTAVHEAFLGTLYASLAENLALIKRSGLNQEKFLDIIEQNCQGLKEIANKGRVMIKQDYTAHTPLKYMADNLKRSLDVSDSFGQSLPITSLAKEVYKRAKNDYGEFDVTAIYEGTDHGDRRAANL